MCATELHCVPVCLLYIDPSGIIQINAYMYVLISYNLFVSFRVIAWSFITVLWPLSCTGDHLLRHCCKSLLTTTKSEV